MRDTLRFGTTPDMIDTLSDQWPTAGSGYPWWPLCFHEFIFIVWTFNAEWWFLCCYSTLFVRGLIVGILIPSSPSLPTNMFTRSVILHPRDLVTCLQAIWRNLTEWAQSTYPSRGWTNPALDHTPQRIPLEYLSCTFIVTMLLCDGWCNQSILRR